MYLVPDTCKNPELYDDSPFIDTTLHALYAVFGLWLVD